MSYGTYLRWVTEPASLSPRLSIVIPTYNESERIVTTITSIVAHLTSAEVEFELIVSDDGSTDDTVSLVRGLEFRNVVVLDDHPNRGKGAAVRAGVAAARGEFVLFTDADLSTPIAELDRMLAVIEHADVVIGTRTHDGPRSRLRSLMSAVVRPLTRAALGLDLSDTQCGFKLFRHDAAMRLFAVQTVDGFTFDAEILFVAATLGLSVREVPVAWIDAPGSKVHPLSNSVRFLVDLAVIRLRAATGRYRFERGTPRGSHEGPSLRLAVVTAIPPSTATLAEYGQYLVQYLATKPEVEELTVLAEDSAGLPEPVDGYRVVAGWTINTLRTPWRLLREVRRAQPDVVLFNCHFTSFGTSKLPAALGLLTPALLRPSRAKTIVLLHNLVDTVDLDRAGFGGSPLVNRLLLAIGRSLTRMILRADWVATTMPEYVDILRSRYGARNVSLTPHGAFTVPEAPAPGPADDRRRILAFGKFGTYKRVDDLVDAYRDLLARGGFEDVELVIAGADSPNAPGYLAGVAAATADLAGVHLTGYVPEDRVGQVFEEASVVVFPYTATTGSSGPLHQAGAHARAVIAPRLGDLIELIEHEGYAVVPFSPDEPGSLTDALAAVLSDPELRDELGRRNFHAAKGLPLAEVCDWHVDQALRLVG